METRKSFTAKGGTTFKWNPLAESDIWVHVPLDKSWAGIGDDFVASIPRADLDEFIAHIVSQAAEETLGRVLLFPCLQPTPPKSAA